MSTRNATVSVAPVRSPLLEEQMGGMSISRYAAPRKPAPLPPPSPSRTAPTVQRVASKAEADRAKLEAYFAEQRRIGSQRPQRVHPMKYDISVYRAADQGCYSSVDSPDWRKREISIRTTDAAIELIDSVIRQPIVEASKKACEGVTAKNMKEKWANHYANTSFHFQDVPDFTRQNPAETRCEYKRFQRFEKSGTVLIAVPHAKILEIAQRIDSFYTEDPKRLTGPVFVTDIRRRVENIVYKFMQPELACMRSGEKVFRWETLSSEVGRQVISLGLNVRLLDSLVEPFIREEREGTDSGVQYATGMVIAGRTGDGIGGLCW